MALQIYFVERDCIREMRTFFIQNFGCRATQADAAAIREQFLAHGYFLASSDGGADVVVLNTCTVTAAADAQAREAIRRTHRENPAARIMVTGCYAQRAPEELAGLEGVAWVVGNSHQQELAGLAGGPRNFVPLAHLGREFLFAAQTPAKILSSGILKDTLFLVARAGHAAEDRTRPTLKIQDGCNSRCAYCVIPLVRGQSRSLPPEAVLAEVRRLVAEGYREIVLAGINLGSYGRDLLPRATLSSLLLRILEESSLDRLRLSSIEPMDITQDFVEVVASSERIAPHFHLPLQSGSDAILKAMHRRYRTAHYARRMEIIRELLPGAAIGADVIAGFPGETEEDHGATLDFIAQMPLTYLHVFSFSPRPGTEGASLAGRVPADVIRRRARELREAGGQKSKAFRAAQAGRVLRVLTLDRSGEDWTEAISGNYLKVRLAGRWPRNRWFDARLPWEDRPADGLAVAT